MNKFKRKIFKKPWHDPGYDGLRFDRKTIPKITDKEMFQCTCNTARKMKKLFGWKDWMENFIDENGKNKSYKEGLIK